MCLGIPGRVVEIADPGRMLGVIDVAGVRRAVDLTCVADGPPGDLLGAWVLVHAGFALSRIDEAEAAATLDALAALGEAAEERDRMGGSGVGPGGPAQ